MRFSVRFRERVETLVYEARVYDQRRVLESLQRHVLESFELVPSPNRDSETPISVSWTQAPPDLARCVASGERKPREPDPETTLLLLEALLCFCATRKGREETRAREKEKDKKIKTWK